MKKYEIGLILAPTLDEATTEATIAKLKAIYTDAGSQIIDEETVGIKEMAYEIEDHATGFYFYMVATANSEINQEFERVCRISEDVLRYLVINVEDAPGNTLDILRK